MLFLWLAGQISTHNRRPTWGAPHHVNMSAPSLSVCSLHLSSLSLFSSESRQLEFRLRPKASAAEGRRRGGAAAGSASQESSAEKRSGAVGEARPGGGVSGWRGGSGNLLRVLALDGGCELRRGSSVFFFFNFFTIFFPKFFSLDLDAIVLLQIFSSYSQTFLFQTFSHQFFPFFLSSTIFIEILSKLL